MRKFIIFLSILIVMGLSPTLVDLIGGGAGALDAIQCDDIRGDAGTTVDPLIDGSIAIYVEPGANGAAATVSFYTFRADVDDTNCTDADVPWDCCTGAGTGACEAGTAVSPYLIIPDDQADCTPTASEGGWVLANSFTLGRSDVPATVYRHDDAADYDDNVKVYIDCTDPATTAEDCDYYIAIQIAGTLTDVMQFDADGNLEILAHDLDLATGKVFKINGTQITSAALSDVASIAMLDEAETITGNWVNTDNPWADNEMADDHATTVAATTDTTSFPALFEDATGNLKPKTDLGLTYNATSNVLNASGGYTGGPAATATALAANGANCGAGQAPLGVDASGAVESCIDLPNTYQPLDADLTTYAGITPSANVQSLMAAANYAAMRTLLDLEVGTDFNAYDADLTTYAGITPSANIQSLLAAANYAAMRTLLDLEVGTDFNAYDADLTTYAGITPSANIQSLLAAANYAAMRGLLDLEAGTDFNAYDAGIADLANITETAGGMLYGGYALWSR
jgi:hypothetical protein